MIGRLRNKTGGLHSLGKVEKLFVDNTNIMFVLGMAETTTGNLRETFFFTTRHKREVLLTV